MNEPGCSWSVQRHVALVGALDRRDAGGDRHPVGVLADLLELLAARDRADQHGGVVERRPDLLARCVQGGGSADLHGVSLAPWCHRRRCVWACIARRTAYVAAGLAARRPRGAAAGRTARSARSACGGSGSPRRPRSRRRTTASRGMTPASPAPLMPSGFSGDGVSRWSISMCGHLGRVGHQEVHERGVEQLAVLVVGHPLVERAADALRDAAVHLALDDHRVDQRPAVVHDAVAQDPDLGGLRVGLDDRGVHAVGEGRLHRRVVVGGLEPGLLVLADRRAGSASPTANWVAALDASSKA